MKTIVFDGEFREADIDWLEDSPEYKEYEQFLKGNGFRTFPTWNSSPPYEDFMDIEVYEHIERAGARLVDICDGSSCFHVLIESNVDYLKGVFVYPRGVQVFNGVAEVKLTSVGRPDAPSMMRAEFDAHAFNVIEGPCPIDWGVISRTHPLAIDYEAMQDSDEELYLALHFTDHDEGYTHPGCSFPSVGGDGVIEMTLDWCHANTPVNHAFECPYPDSVSLCGNVVKPAEVKTIGRLTNCAACVQLATELGQEMPPGWLEKV